MKKCTKCHKTQSLSEFYRNKRTKDGLAHHCKTCSSNYLAARSLSLGVSLIEERRAVKMRHKYGIGPLEYDSLLVSQKGVCAICGNKETVQQRGITQSLAIDHCHKTGKVRGLLCSKCNSAIGLLGDNLDLLASAASYLVNTRI